MERSGLYEKAERQRLIKQLIMQQEIETQDELITVWKKLASEPLKRLFQEISVK